MSQSNSPSAGLWPNDVLAQGTVLNGYRITRILGRGGFGITYLAEDMLGQNFALKEYFPLQFAVRQGAQVHATSEQEAPVFEECRARFVQEARALLLLGQARGFRDDIVRVQTFFEANGTAYMVMEYVRGPSLQAALREHPGGMPEADLRYFLANLLAGLAAVHSVGLMHRDIKPGNILLRDGGRPVLIDFGSSRDASSQQTRGFTQIFSAGHAPPEQILGTRQGPFSDIYAVGTVCYEAIGGRVTDSLARQNACATGAPDPMLPAVRIGADRYAPDLLAVIDAALAIDPTDRPASASDMARLLQATHQDDATVLSRATVIPPAATPRHLSAAAVVGVIVLGIAGLAAILTAWVWLTPPTPNATTSPPPVGSAPPVATIPLPAPPVEPPQVPEQTSKPPAPEAPPAPPPNEPPSTLQTKAPQPAPASPSQTQPPAAVPPAPTVGQPGAPPSPVPHRAAVPSPAPARPAPPHEPALNSARCAGITARVQLGEDLTDADRAALRTFCKR
jgi:serine/threonine protein kinase